MARGAKARRAIAAGAAGGAVGGARAGAVMGAQRGAAAGAANAAGNLINVAKIRRQVKANKTARIKSGLL